MIRQPFHLVEKSPWPLTGSAGAFSLTVGLAAWFHGYSPLCLILGLTLTILTMIQWWRDVIRESTFLGHHTSYVVKGLRWGMALFIVSEIMFFFAFFWAFFHSSLAPTPELGCVWPPKGLTPMNPFATPMLNTAILLGSGVMVTWAHHSILDSDLQDAIRSLSYTILMAASFTLLQIDEYKEASFTMADSIYGSTFFVATGFHGLHVVIGTAFLSVCLFRLAHHHFSTGHHFGFEAAAWYWHFVDVVWILLYLCIYWWGS